MLFKRVLLLMKSLNSSCECYNIFNYKWDTQYGILMTCSILFVFLFHNTLRSEI